MTPKKYAAVGIINDNLTVLHGHNEIELQTMINETSIKDFRRCILTEDPEAIGLVLENISNNMRMLEQSDDLCYSNGRMDDLRRLYNSYNSMLGEAERALKENNKQ